MTDSNPYEKKVFIGVKEFTLHIDNAGYKYIQWTGKNEYNVLYDYEVKEILDRIEGVPDQNINLSASPPSWINEDDETSETIL